MRLGVRQRVVIVVAIGAALLAVGDYITSLGIPTGWMSYAPLRVPFPGGSGLSAGPRLAVWLLLTALWLAVSLFILREQPEVGAVPAAAVPAPAAGYPAAASGSPAATAGEPARAREP